MLINSFQNQTNLADSFPPTTTTDTKSEIAKGESVGVVDSVGVALFIDDDIPPIFAESGIFDKAE